MSRVTRSGFRAAFGVLAPVVLAAAAVEPAAAGDVRISMERGRVTVIAIDARLADVLAEWSRVGATRFVGAEPLGGEPVTLHLIDAAEADAIRLLLRSAAGYVAAPRRAGAAGASRYDRVTVLATRRTSVAPAMRSAAADRGAAVGAGTSPPAAAAGAAAEPPEMVSMEELQRLLDAAGAGPAGAPADTGAAPREIPVVTTPFPGVGAGPGLPAVRWPRGRRGP